MNGFCENMDCIFKKWSLDIFHQRQMFYPHASHCGVGVGVDLRLDAWVSLISFHGMTLSFPTLNALFCLEWEMCYLLHVHMSFTLRMGSSLCRKYSTGRWLTLYGKHFRCRVRTGEGLLFGASRLKRGRHVAFKNDCCKLLLNYLLAYNICKKN